MTASGCRRAWAMNNGMSAQACWPSASICSTWLRPRRAASRKPATMAAPLPWLEARRTSVTPSRSAAASASSTVAQGGELPSSTRMQGRPCPRTCCTTAPMVVPWSNTGTTTTGSGIGGPEDQAATGVHAFGRAVAERQMPGRGIPVEREFQRQWRQDRALELQLFRPQEAMREREGIPRERDRPIQLRHSGQHGRTGEVALEDAQILRCLQREHSMRRLAIPPLHGGQVILEQGREQSLRGLALGVDRQLTHVAEPPRQHDAFEAARQLLAQRVVQGAL